ncbi:tyrosine-protein kinase receptor torso-like isoform X2 [Plodia interpunctella]|uniref:tyrosine-protein kinase receptor torso-like isoform X2 n=1 Tax=Plodia interpunctella TaxID=58824 RepID=UPI002368927F|nr:tyrosine-protein kinase receptor torso-like isoform X2 [Plodia interpunctella]
MTPFKYVILVNILCEINISVMAEMEPSDIMVAATSVISNDMVIIAEDVCRDLLIYLDEESVENVDVWLHKCKENFSNEAVLPLNPPHIQLCRLEDVVPFRLSPTEDPWRLVILVPNNENVTDITNYSLKEKDESYGSMVTVPGGSYTVWTTTLNSQGEHSPWLRGPEVLPWKSTNEYSISKELQFEDSSRSTVRAKFQWDRNDASTACYNVIFSCENREIIDKTVWPNVKNERGSWVVRNLPVKVQCEFRLSDWRGINIIGYKTDCQEATCSDKSAEQIKANDETNSQIVTLMTTGEENARIGAALAIVQENERTDTIIATEQESVHTGTAIATGQENAQTASGQENFHHSAIEAYRIVTATATIAREVNILDIEPQNVTLMATESGNGWDVTVGWVPPKIIPDRYNVTLVGRHVRKSVKVPGNVKEAIIRNIEDEGFYYVIIDVIGKNSSRTSRNAVFPERSNLTGLITSVAVLSAIIFLVGCVMFLRKRRADKQKRSHFLDLDEKPSKDTLETFDVESSRTEEYWEVGSRRLLLHEVVGEGAFGVVRRGTLAGEEVAVKMLKDFPTQDEIRSFHAEIDLMRLMKTVGRHAHVLNLVECSAGRRPLILTEYCSGGDLLSYLRCIWDVMVSKRKAKYYNNNIESCEYRNDLFKCKFERQHSKLVINKLYDLQGICDTELTSRDLLSFCRQIAMGMDFLASNKVVHRDLAARNILVARDRTLKIADFGLSRDVYEENQYKQKGNGKIPVKWMALESLERKIYTTKSDIWSFGVVVWEIVTVGGSPYPDVPPARLLRFLREGYRMQRPNNCSRELYELMLSCWHVQPSARPSFSALHRRLDELLNCACASDYLSLEMIEDRPVTLRNRYVRMINVTISERN